MSATNGSITTSVFERIAALDGTNYRSWAFALKMLLKAHELWEVIEDEEEGGEEAAPKAVAAKKMETKAWKKKDQLALSNIALAVKPSEQEHIYSCATAKEAWNCLKELYEGKGTHRFLSLLKSISTAKLEDGVAMKDYIRGVRQTADQLSEMNVKLEKAAVVEFILNGLPEGYRYLVVNLESQVQTISYEDLSARLMDEEKRTLKLLNMDARSGMGIGDSDDVKGYVARSKGRVCHNCQESGHFARECPERLKSIRCNWCGKMGHKEAKCSVKEFQGKNNGSSKQQCAAYQALGVFDDDFCVPAH